MSLNLEDIAKLAGVSRSTVSRVINDRSDVSESTRKKVMRIIDEHNFRPNLAARTLVTQRSKVIGTLLPQSPTALSSLYFPNLLEGIGDTTHQRDYATLLWWGQSGEEEQRFTKRILQKNQLMEGLIIAAHTLDNSLIQRIFETKIPFVMVERPAIFNDQINYVTVDKVAGAKTPVEHLINLGRRRIGHITGILVNVDGMDRLTGYRNALERHNLPMDPDLIVEGHFNQKFGYLGMKQLLKQGVDAVFAGNDDSAVGALQALREARVRIPADVALVGFDDVTSALDFAPQLTTIHQPIRQKGALATALLLDLIEGKVKSPQHILLPTHLVIRQSCGA